LTGNKKFEVDEKLGLQEFMKLIESVCEGNYETENVLITKLEESTQGNMVFKDDPDNQIFKKLVQIIKEMKKTGKK
jgi:hypothetical protein